MTGLMLALAVSCFGAEPTAATPVTLANAEQFEVKSQTGQAYRIYLYKPAGEAPQDGYGVLYFTDANNAFPVAVSLSKMVERLTGPIVLVGIGYPTEDRAEITRLRTFDLTPETPAEDILKFQAARRAAAGRDVAARVPMQAAVEIKTGGNEAFFEFIQNELKPLIAKRVTINPAQQAFFGHSYGGLFALYGVLAHPEAFQTYIVASPSLWVNPRRMSELEKELADKAPQLKHKPRVLVTLGGEEAGVLAKENPAPSKESGAAQLTKRLQALGLDATYQEFSGENHGSVIPFALMSGIRHAFEPQRAP